MSSHRRSKDSKSRGRVRESREFGAETEEPTTPPQSPPSRPPAISVTPSEPAARTRHASGSDTERDSSKMASRPSKHHSSSGSKKHHSSSKKAKSDDWTEVTEPEERRRIQNRIAQ